MNFQTLENIVSSYQDNYQPIFEKQLEYFCKPTLQCDVIKRAVLSELPDGVLAPHQRRVGRQNLRNAERYFQAISNELFNANDFEGIIKLVRERAENLHRIGKLTSYDIALRIGANREIHPATVYLHTGAKEGARNLGFYRHEIPKKDIIKTYGELNDLSERSIENFLCTFRNQLAPFTRLSTPPE